MLGLYLKLKSKYRSLIKMGFECLKKIALEYEMFSIKASYLTPWQLRVFLTRCKCCPIQRRKPALISHYLNLYFIFLSFVKPILSLKPWLAY